MLNKSLDITVCILSFNRRDFLREATQSVLQQTLSPAEIFIFDNGSTENVVEGVQEYFNKGVSWVGAECTRSVFWNFRRAVAQVQTKYALIMHDDDKLCPDFLEKQFEFLECHSNVLAVSVNGYLINEDSSRNGSYIIPFSDVNDFELFECSGDVALKYAKNSCIPFSSIVYRTDVLKKIDLREEYGKVCDAVFLCDIADTGILAYRAIPLYECRIHSGQDSSSFPLNLILKLENFFGTRKTKSDDQLKELNQALIAQHTLRNIHNFIRDLSNSNSFVNIGWAFLKMFDKQFSVFAAFRLSVKFIHKRFIHWLS